MAELLKGLEVTKAMREKMIFEVEELNSMGITPTLGIIRVGARPDDLSYEKGAVKRCESVGVKVKVFELGENISQAELEEKIKEVNNDSLIHGILLFRPLPAHLNEENIKFLVSPQKDIDCMNPINIAKVFAGDESGFAPCTPEAVVEILDYYNIPVEGKNVAVIGRSMIVGKPLSMLLLKRNATITICHTRTKNITDITKNAEILIVAAGKAKLVTRDYISPGAVVIDVGINVDEKGNLCGDVDFNSVEEVAGKITPVPGGVGTVTTSVLVKHVIKAAKLNNLA
ncbi:MAG TPA: bifunctional 5,10-methylene-tetrahydrofolate dehydrogenase/5,10-methylene-tetrahydrofolate cyclohydrolase [Clostridiaceae bacterium]|nr:bifunctional 5,10-methylene-tetrahydrofolate dehydrogenase/5,10-methylene-tetrahydrofolate cyclohydrolase [Clostridiaceae bacterium]